MVAHEIMYFFSVGMYTQIVKEQWKHHFGIGDYIYQSENGTLFLTEKKFHNGINELITGYIVWILLRDKGVFAKPLYNCVVAFGDYVEGIYN